MAWTSDDLVWSAKRRGSIPTAQGLFSSQDFLDYADEELQSYVVPIVQGVREDHGVVEVDITLTPGTASYRIPQRAVGSTLREVIFLDPSGNLVNPPRINTDDVYGRLYRCGFRIMGADLVYVGNAQGFPGSLRLSYPIRPGRLVKAAEAAVITSIDYENAVVTLAALTAPAHPLLPAPVTPAPDFFTGETTFDIIRGSPPFDHIAIDLSGSYDAGTNQITFSQALPLELPFELNGQFATVQPIPAVRVGDVVSLADTSPFPQIPAELHPLLAQKVAAKCLEAMGFDGELKTCLAILQRMEKDVPTLISQRVQGEPVKVVSRSALWRRR